MPRHDYRCPVCGKTEERTSFFWEGVLPLEFCSLCKTEMERLPATSNVVLKGTGWTPKGNTKCS